MAPAAFERADGGGIRELGAAPGARLRASASGGVEEAGGAWRCLPICVSSARWRRLPRLRPWRRWCFRTGGFWGVCWRGRARFRGRGCRFGCRWCRALAAGGYCDGLLASKVRCLERVGSWRRAAGAGTARGMAVLVGQLLYDSGLRLLETSTLR